MYDVIVVGGGPSGSSAARKSAQLGMKTLLLDKAIFPRDKLCGGGVSEQAMSYLDFEIPPEIVGRDIYGARLHFREYHNEIRKPYRVAITARRAKFDHHLLLKAQEAGVEVMEDRRVSAVDTGEQYAEVTADGDKFRARVVIGSDGFNSVIARAVRPKHTKDQYGVCLESYIPATDQAVDEFASNVVVIHFDVVYGGYGWVFPHQGSLAVGIGGLASRISDPKAVMQKYLEITGFPADVKTKGHPIPAGGVKRETVADRLILSGDAAGFVDTFYGEGIAFAIRSGQLAGETAAAAIQAGNCSKQQLSMYRRLCRDEFERDLRISFYFSHLVHKFPDTFLKLIASEKQALEKYVDIAARKETYLSFLRWLLPRLPIFLLKR